MGKWRVGFISTRNLFPGDELTWDYGVLPEQTPETKRKRFTGEETELIHAAFAVNIVENTAPILQQCKMILGRIQSTELDSRNPKDVQDKVKNIRKN